MSTYSEVVTIFVGHAGTQVSRAFWELLCNEHRINDGFKIPCKLDNTPDNTYYSFFVPLPSGKLIPRTVIVDLEPTVINEIKTGAFQNLYHPDSLIAGKEDAANNFATGYSIGQKTIDVTLECIRRISENCSNLNALMIFRSLSGGTGSGFGTLLLEHLADDYGKKLRLDFTIYPAPNISSVIVEPYNFVLSTHGTMEHRHCCFAVDNEALYDICAKRLRNNNPTFVDFNRLQAQVISGITTPMRFKSAKSLKLQELLINLIPYPRTHTVLTGYAPIMCKQMNYSTTENVTLENITNESFEPINQMLKCDPRVGTYLSCCLLYRGKIDMNDIRRSIASLKIKKSIHIHPLNPIGFTMGINYQPPITLSNHLADSNRFVTNLSNNTTIRHTWCRLASKFDSMYKRKSFFHHYIDECMDKDYFDDARANLNALLEEYKELEE